jgi:hypothetical protein
VVSWKTERASGTPLERAPPPPDKDSNHSPDRSISEANVTEIAQKTKQKSARSAECPLPRPLTKVCAMKPTRTFMCPPRAHLLALLDTSLEVPARGRLPIPTINPALCSSTCGDGAVSVDGSGSRFYCRRAQIILQIVFV